MGKDEVKAILHTGGKSDRILMEEGGMVSIKDLPWLRAVANAWDGVEVRVKKSQGESYSLVGWNECDCEIDARVKEAIWQMEQDPIFGTYCGNREDFEEAWREGKYEPAGGISFMAKNVEILDETEEEHLIRLITAHPGMKILQMVDAEVCHGEDSGYWAGTIGWCRVSEYILADKNSLGSGRIWERYEAGELVDLISEDAEEKAVAGKALSQKERDRIYQEARRKAWEKVAQMPWQRAIIVDVTTLDEDTEEVNV